MTTKMTIWPIVLLLANNGIKFLLSPPFEKVTITTLRKDNAQLVFVNICIAEYVSCSFFSFYNFLLIFYKIIISIKPIEPIINNGIAKEVKKAIYTDCY